MRHLDRHAVGIAEGDRVVAGREVVELGRRLQDLRAGVLQHGIDLVDLGRGSRPTRQATARPARSDTPSLRLAHHEMIVAARPHHPAGARPDAMEAQCRQPQAMEGDGAAEVADFDGGAGKGGALLHQRSGRPSARSSSRRRSSSPARKNSSSCGGLIARARQHGMRLAAMMDLVLEEMLEDVGDLCRRRLAVGPRQDAVARERLVGLALAEGDQPLVARGLGQPQRRGRRRSPESGVAIAAQRIAPSRASM